MNASGATYRIGPSDFFSPSDLAADADTLDRQMKAFDLAIDGNDAIPQSLWEAWLAFYAEWTGFKHDNFGGFFTNLATAANDSNRDALIAYERRFESIAADIRPYGGQLPEVARVRPSTGSGDSVSKHLEGLGLPSLPTLAALGGVIVAAIVLWKVLK